MKILITNDDGVSSAGILAVKNAVDEFGETTIVAPVRQQSGVGHGITLGRPLRIFPTTLNNGTMCYGVDGTPADSVIMAVKQIMDEEPDLIISGINVGENLSKSITTSGTLGATFEAVNLGIPAIAVSVQVKHETLKFRDGVSEIDFSFAEKILKKVVRKVVEKGMPDGVEILNLNIPAEPVSDEIIQARFGERMYNTKVEKRVDPYNHEYYWVISDSSYDDADGTDIHTVRFLNYPSITPMCRDMDAGVDLGNWMDE